MKKYSTLTIAKIRETLKEWFHGKQKNTVPQLTYQQLKDKVLNGYWYSISTGDPPYKKHDIRRTKINTGRGGILSYIDACERIGIMTADQVAESIICHTTNGDFNMLELKVYPKKE